MPRSMSTHQNEATISSLNKPTDNCAMKDTDRIGAVTFYNVLTPASLFRDQLSFNPVRDFVKRAKCNGTYLFLYRFY